ncbi:MAG: ATP-binding cassette domain-containing protein, partial [Lachnospiraceae bacterium]|nr:ATP-binding cassette domain-containing protein [Lachnospiraceae bacterium]
MSCTSYSAFDDQHVYRSFHYYAVGKSTLLSIIAGLLSPEQGTLFYRGRCLADCGDDDRITIGYMLQRDHLFEWRTIYQNVILGLE